MFKCKFYAGLGYLREVLFLVGIHNHMVVMEAMYMKRIIVIIAMFYVLIYISTQSASEVVSFTIEESQWLESSPTINIGYDIDYAPIQFELDGTMVGISADYLDWIEKNYNITFNRIPFDTFEEMIKSLVDGEIDVASAVAHSEDRSEYMNFTDSFISVKSVALVRKDFSKTLTENTLMNESVAVVNSFLAHEELAKKYPNKSFVLVDSIQDGLIGLSIGNYDVFIAEISQSSYYTEQLSITNLKALNNIELNLFYDLSFATAKGERMIVNFMNKAIKNMPESVHVSIFNRWVYMQYEPLFKKEIFIGLAVLLISILIFIGIIILWNNTLKKEVAEKTQSLREELKKRIEAEKDLADLNSELEVKVIERTNLLNHSNEELKLSLQQLENTQEQLVEIKKMAALTNVVVGMAHELNTPVGICITTLTFLQNLSNGCIQKLGNHELKRSELNEYFSDVIKSYNIMDNSLTHTRKTIENFKQISMDNMSADVKEINLKEYLIFFFSELQEQINNKTIEVEYEFDSRLTITCSNDALERMFSNLFLNSVDHGFSDQKVGLITIHAQKDENSIHLEYKDNGCGIPESYQAKIFEPFYTTTRGKGNVGLGLNIVYNIVKYKLHGEIHCTSSLGEGTTFFIRIPITHDS